MILFVAIVGALEFAFLILVIIMFIKRSQSLDIFHRLRRHVDTNTKLQETADIVQRVYNFVKQTAKPLDDSHLSKKLDYLLKQAGLPIFGAEFIVIALIAAFFTMLIVYMITFNTTIAPFAGLMTPLLMWAWVMVLVNRRRRAFTEQLGDCLTTVANALRAGYSFQQAMDVVAREMEPPMSSEFERVSTDVAMGVSLENALEQMNNRVGSPDFDLVVTAVLIQREIGGNLAQILDSISETIQERIRMKREIKALTAQGRFSAWVLLLLPFATAVFCWIFNHEQMMLFVNEESGHIAIAVAIILEVLGFLIIQKIVDIEI